MKRKVLLVIGIAAACAGIAIGAVKWDINRDVKIYIRIAQQAHPVESDDVASLIAYVNSSEHTLKEKNHVVWALGQIGDTRAAAALRPYYTGEKCNHADELCQKELRKALDQCQD